MRMATTQDGGHYGSEYADARRLDRKAATFMFRSRKSRGRGGLAMSIIDDDSLRVTDRLVWDVLKRLGAVSLPAPDREFLYTVTDFKEWLSELL